MDFRPRSEPEIHQIAEAVILGYRSLNEYRDLSKDDRARVERIVERGSEGLGALERKVQVQKRQLRGRLGRSPTGTALVSEAPQEDLAELFGGLGAPAFDVGQLISDSMRRSYVAELQRALSPDELAAYASTLSADQLTRLTDGLADGQRLRWEPAAGLSDHERERALGKAGWVAVRFLEGWSDLQGEGQTYLEDFKSRLAKRLHSHSQQLMQVLRVPERLGQMDERQQRILLGLTPREDLARFGPALEPGVLNALLTQLPARQQQDLREELEHYAQRRKQDLRDYLPMFAAVKNWGATVKKARES